MTNASLKEQLQAVASQLSDPRATPTAQKKIRQNDQNKKVKPRWLDYVQYGVELLKAYFPASFKSNNEIKPLKKGIKQDLVKKLSMIAEIVIDDKACMVKSLSYYVNTNAYLKSVVAGATRVDLDGQPAGLVTEEEAKYSIERQKIKQQAKTFSNPN